MDIVEGGRAVTGGQMTSSRAAHARPVLVRGRAPDEAPLVRIAARRDDARAVRLGLASLGWRMLEADHDGSGLPDLWIVVARSVDAAAAERLAALRAPDAANPFAAVILVCAAASAGEADAASQAGVDAMVRAAEGVVGLRRRAERIAALPDRRFVVTRDYVGPDRPSSARPHGAGTGAAPTVEAPNTLRMRLEGRSPAAISAGVEASRERMRRLRSEACAFALAFALHEMDAAVHAGDLSAVGRAGEARRWLSLAMAAFPAPPDRARAVAVALDEILRRGADDALRMLRESPRACDAALDLLALARADGDRARARAEVALAVAQARRRAAPRHVREVV